MNRKDVFSCSFGFDGNYLDKRMFIECLCSFDYDINKYYFIDVCTLSRDIVLGGDFHKFKYGEGVIRLVYQDFILKRCEDVEHVFSGLHKEINTRLNYDIKYFLDINGLVCRDIITVYISTKIS